MPEGLSLIYKIYQNINTSWSCIWSLEAQSKWFTYTLLSHSMCSWNPIPNQCVMATKNPKTDPKSWRLPGLNVSRVILYRGWDCFTKSFPCQMVTPKQLALTDASGFVSIPLAIRGPVGEHAARKPQRLPSKTVFPGAIKVKNGQMRMWFPVSLSFHWFAVHSFLADVFRLSTPMNCTINVALKMQLYNKAFIPAQSLPLL